MRGTSDTVYKLVLRPLSHHSRLPNSSLLSSSPFRNSTRHQRQFNFFTMAQEAVVDSSLAKRLEDTHAKIEQICEISGNAGLSVGILHHGQVIHLANYGYRDVEAKIKPDSDTIYHLGSLTKFVTSAALATFVDEGKLTWESRLADVLPGYWQTNEDRQEHANIIDILAHRMALEMRVPYWAQMHNQLLLPSSQGVNVLGALQSTGKFRKDLKYNNWTYGVAGDVLEKLSGKSLEQCVKHRLTDPLGLERTTMGVPSSDNYAKSYMCLNDGTPYEVPAPALTSGGIVGACGALKSSVNDMLVVYDSVLKAFKHQKETGDTKTDGSPFAQTVTMFAPHITKNKTSYGLGWFLTELPGEIGWIGLNEARVKKMPQIARDTGLTQIAYHNGNMPGALSSVHLIPETHTAIAVFANSIPFSDVPDWVGGLLLEAMLDTPDPNDFVALAKESRETTLAKMEATRKQLQQEQDKTTPVKPLEQYVGKYFNNIGNFYLDVTVNGDGLKMCVQGFDSTCYDLEHSCNDTFAWECNREKEVRNVMFPSWYDEMHKVHFVSGKENGTVDRTVWKYARDVPTPGETFMKSLDGQPFCWQSAQVNGGLARI